MTGTAYMAVYCFMGDRDERGWIRSKCGNEISCLRRYWTTRQRTYRIRGVSEDYIRVCTRMCYATGKQLNTYIDAYAGINGHLYLPSRIQATLNARVTTAVKTFLNITDFASSFIQSAETVPYRHREKWTLQYDVTTNFINCLVDLSNRFRFYSSGENIRGLQARTLNFLRAIIKQ